MAIGGVVVAQSAAGWDPRRAVERHPAGVLVVHTVGLCAQLVSVPPAPLPVSAAIAATAATAKTPAAPAATTSSAADPAATAAVPPRQRELREQT